MARTTMFVQLMVSCLLLWQGAACKSYCPKGQPGQPGPLLLQVKVGSGLAPSRSETSYSFEDWITTQVAESVPEVPPQRELPQCSLWPTTLTCLPSFLVIGVQKSGTSTLFNILRKHPQIQPAKTKELLWFNGEYGKVRCNPPNTAPSDADFSLNYLPQFPALQPTSQAISGEFSATYLHCWCCPAAIRRLMPLVRLVVQLRDPIERALSRWQEERFRNASSGTEDSFPQFVMRRLPALESCLKIAVGLQEQVNCTKVEPILGFSLYDTSLKLWLEHFPQQLLVTYLEQLAVAPGALFDAVHAHLGVQRHTYKDSLLHAHYNRKGNYGWNAQLLGGELVDATSARKLYAFYRPCVVQLKTMADAGMISSLPASWVARWQL